MKLLLVGGLSALFLLGGCDHEDRIARLEKEAKATKEAQSDKDRVADYDLREKCAKDARVWFNENWSRDKDTLLLDFRDHYKKSQNKCFIEVEFHYSNPSGSASWMNNIQLFDVYENSKYGSFLLDHEVNFRPAYKIEENVLECTVYGKECKTLQEFNNLSWSYMAN
jgi:hypothetical protein